MTLNSLRGLYLSESFFNEDIITSSTLPFRNVCGFVFKVVGKTISKQNMLLGLDKECN